MNLNTEQYFATVPTIDAPRSTFDRSFTHKMTMNTDYLYPIFIDEALPGDSMKLDFECFGRALNPLVVPIMDELYFETLWFKADCRLLWNNFYHFCGEQDNPNDSVDFVIPTISSSYNATQGGTPTIYDAFTCGNIADCFGIPPYVRDLTVNSLPFRMYNRVYNEWFRDENLINSVNLELGDSDTAENYKLLKSAKIHDYFTSCLPFTQKGDSVSIPIGDIIPDGFMHFMAGDNSNPTSSLTGPVNVGLTYSSNKNYLNIYALNTKYPNAHNQQIDASGLQYSSGLQLNGGVSVEDFRFAMKLQRKREMDAIGGTRYVEWVKSHFGVTNPDARHFMTEFLGSTREMIDINTVIQSGENTQDNPLGSLGAYAVISHHGSGFSTSFEEHGYLMGIARIRHNPIYQQGLHKMWKRSTLLDFYLPIFNGLGEQPVYNYELYAQSDTLLDNPNMLTFGFNEAFAEYRFKPSYVSGLLRSHSNSQNLYPQDLVPIDFYHLSENFATLPLLNQSFIEEDVPLKRSQAIQADEQENPLNYPDFIMDFRFNYVCTRTMPVRNIPDGLGSGRF